MRLTASVVYLAIDDLLPHEGPIASGVEELLGKLTHAGIPCVWLTSQTRLQIDAPRRKLGHRDPFIAEDGCGVYLPEDYFHLRPQSPRAGSARGRPSSDAPTMRLGRFTCLPVAQRQPAASEALEELAAETGVSVVPLQSLPPRQLAQNTGLRPREAELARQRDFDEVFFFAGAPAEQIDSFAAAARSHGMQLRPHGALWSLAIGADPAKCVRELTKLYDRALHAHAKSIGVGIGENPQAFLSACDRNVFMTTQDTDDGAVRPRGVLKVPLNSADPWERLADFLLEPR